MGVQNVVEITKKQQKNLFNYQIRFKEINMIIPNLNILMQKKKYLLFVVFMVNFTKHHQIIYMVMVVLDVKNQKGRKILENI